MNLADLSLKDSYSSDEDDIVHEFYNPVLSCAVSYDRITGYFSPAVMAIASRGFAGLIKNNGKIRILTSVQVNAETYNAVSKSEVTEIDENIFKNIEFDIESLRDELQKDYLRVFMYLYKTGSIELKVAILDKGEGILHQKVGIVRDVLKNAISFSGSNNETPGGIVSNIEEFKVFKNWIISSSPYFANDETKFEKYWNNKVDGISVFNISDAIKDKLISLLDDDEDIETIIKRIRNKEKIRENVPEKRPENLRLLRDYQLRAINH